MTTVHSKYDHSRDKTEEASDPQHFDGTRNDSTKSPINLFENSHLDNKFDKICKRMEADFCTVSDDLKADFRKVYAELEAELKADLRKHSLS